jgi:hypothetical protein
MIDRLHEVNMILVFKSTVTINHRFSANIEKQKVNDTTQEKRKGESQLSEKN